MKKSALLERLVRLAATDVPHTPRLLMRHRSPEELAALQHGVEGAFKKIEEPAKQKMHALIDKVPHPKVQKVLKGGADMMIENPEMIPMQAVPIPGVSLGYLAAKKGLERGLDKLAPMPKVAAWKDKLPGGLSDKKKPEDFDPAALHKGRKVESEHTKDKHLQTEISMDHLTEDPKYYEKLERVEKKAFSTNAFSGQMNPVIETGASFQPGFKVPSLRAPVQQKTAEEFKLQGHTKFQELPIAIENRKGSVRKGVDKDGKPWRTVMKLPYGYIKGSKGADGEEVDCYLGPKKDATHAFVVHQKKDDGSYDEDKVMLGQESVDAARKAYLAHYNTDRFLGPIKAVPMERFKQLVESGKKLVKISSFVSAEELRAIGRKDPAALARLKSAVEQGKKKSAASSPTRGGFMLASDIPQFKAPSLRAPIEKNSDFLPDYVTYNEGDFKKSKYAAALERERAKTLRAVNGDHYQYLLDKERGDGVDNGDIAKEDAVPVEKQADVSPTQPLGDGGGNPHRMQSWLASPQINSLRAPLNKLGEDGGGDYGGPAGFYYGSWQGGGGRGPVNEAGFRQASDQNGVPVNSLRAPLKKLAGFLATGPSAAKHIGQKPFMQTSVADVAKPKGQKFGGPLPGANSTTLGGYNPPSLK